jgi:hypothetical protein
MSASTSAKGCGTSTAQSERQQSVDAAGISEMSKYRLERLRDNICWVVVSLQRTAAMTQKTPAFVTSASTLCDYLVESNHLRC